MPISSAAQEQVRLRSTPDHSCRCAAVVDPADSRISTAAAGAKKTPVIELVSDARAKDQSTLQRTAACTEYQVGLPTMPDLLSRRAATVSSSTMRIRPLHPIRCATCAHTLVGCVNLAYLLIWTLWWLVRASLKSHLYFVLENVFVCITTRCDPSHWG